MNTKIISFSIVSLLFMAMPLVASLNHVDLGDGLKIVLAVLAFLFAILAIAMVVVEICKSCKAEEVFKTRTQLIAEINTLEAKKTELKTNVEELEAKKKDFEKDIEELSDKIDAQTENLNAVRAEKKLLQGQIETYQEISEKLTRIESLILG